VQDQGLGQGPTVVLDLVEKAKLAEGSTVFFDNLFTTFSLLDKLCNKGIAGTGIVIRVIPRQVSHLPEVTVSEFYEIWHTVLYI
jgi:hypothetical protein